MEFQNIFVTKPISDDIKKLGIKSSFLEIIKYKNNYTSALSSILLKHFNQYYPEHIKDGIIEWWRSTQVEDAKVSHALIDLFNSIASDQSIDIKQYISGRKYHIATAIMVTAVENDIDCISGLVLSR